MTLRETEAPLREVIARAIKTEFVYPPIPIRAYDWRAYRDGWDLGEPIGEGPTEQAAIADLITKEEEAEDVDG